MTLYVVSSPFDTDLSLQDQPAVCTSNAHKTLMVFLHKIPFHLSGWRNSKQYKNSYYWSSSLSATSAHENDKMIRLSRSFLPLFHLFAYRSQVGSQLRSLQQDLSCLKWTVYMSFHVCLFMHSTPTVNSDCCPFWSRACSVCWHSLQHWFLISILI